MRRKESGFILIEIIFAIAITGVIMGVVAMTIMTLLTNPQRSASHNIVLNQVQNAGYLISHDVQMAKTVTLGEPRGFPLTLVIPVNTNPDNDYSISYFIVDDSLKRQVGGSPATCVARYIEVENTTFDQVDSIIYRLIIKANVGDIAVEESYDIYPRVNAG